MDENKHQIFKEINDLVKAYEFALNNRLTIYGFFKAHGILSQTLLDKIE